MTPKPARKKKARKPMFTHDEIEVAFAVRMLMDLNIHGDVSVPFVRSVIAQMEKIKASRRSRK